MHMYYICLDHKMLRFVVRLIYVIFLECSRILIKIKLYLVKAAATN